MVFNILDLPQFMNLTGFFLRWLFALLLIMVTFNPTGYSLFHWVWPFANEQLPLKILVMVVVLACYIFYVSASMKSLGALGIVVVFAFCAMILMLSLVLGLGVSWSHIKKRITGQFDTDDIGE